MGQLRPRGVLTPVGAQQQFQAQSSEQCSGTVWVQTWGSGCKACLESCEVFPSLVFKIILTQRCGKTVWKRA